MQHTPGFIRLVEEAKKNVKEVAVNDAAKLAKEGAILIDVREESEWTAGHAVGAIHMSKGTIERDIETRVPEVERMILCYCGGGFRSALVIDNLQKMGYRRAYSVDGGWRAWKEAKLPTATGPEKYPRGPYEKLGGIYLLPRLIDKCRLCPQGKLPGYNYLTVGMDKLLLEFLCIEGKQFEQRVTECTHDDEVLGWLKMQLGPGWPGESTVGEFNDKVRCMRPTTPERIEWFEKMRSQLPPTRRRVETYFDLLDLDEGRWQD